ncbi:MAG: hypothetical protein ACW964_17085 [Candidatus Hodarchaeales archaeon]|jgi:bacterioferritin (cytochrome b1)
MSKQERIEFYKEQIDLENTIHEKAKTSVKGVDNILINELIMGIALDSKKHATLLNALVSLHTKGTPSISEDYGAEIKNNIAEHIELERKAIDTYRELLTTIVDESEKIIIRAILNEEIKHHSLLKTIQKMVVEKTTLSEKEFWDMVEEDQYGYIPYSD